MGMGYISPKGNIMNFDTENFNTSNSQDNNQNDELKITCSGIIRKGDEKCIYVRFERGKKYAEGIIPDKEIIASDGFTDEELNSFKEYMREYSDDIISQAKQINLIKNFMK